MVYAVIDAGSLLFFVFFVLFTKFLTCGKLIVFIGGELFKRNNKPEKMSGEIPGVFSGFFIFWSPAEFF